MTAARNSTIQSGGRVGRNAAMLAASQIVTWVSSLVMLAILPRLLGSEDLGRLAVIGFVASILAPIVDFGASTHLNKEIPVLPELEAAELATSQLFLRVPLVILSLIFLAAVELFLIDDSEIRLVLLISAPGVIFPALVPLMSGVLRGYQDMAPLAWADAISRTAGLVLTPLVL